nr:hypothetical protein B0A51_04957 [Rachicladosporium sp. CCFEE 5018]
MPWTDYILWRRSHPSDDPAPPSKSAAPTKSNGTWTSPLNARDYTHYTNPQTLVFAGITTASTLALIKLYKNHLRRIPGAEYLKPGFFRRRSLYGYVTSVGDADGLRLFHTPGGRLMGWGWWRQVGVKAKGKGRGIRKTEGTLSIRIAGIDAPEMAHFGKEEQAYSKEAFEWLREFTEHKYVRVYPYRNDQFGRVVGSVFRRQWVVWNTDVGLQMLKRGLATVYEAKSGAEFGESEALYRETEAQAKSKGVGIWRNPGFIGKLLGQEKAVESPREYKTRTSQQEHGKRASPKPVASSATASKPEVSSSGWLRGLLRSDSASPTASSDDETPTPQGGASHKSEDHLKLLAVDRVRLKGCVDAHSTKQDPPGEGAKLQTMSHTTPPSASYNSAAKKVSAIVELLEIILLDEAIPDVQLYSLQQVNRDTHYTIRACPALFSPIFAPDQPSHPHLRQIYCRETVFIANHAIAQAFGGFAVGISYFPHQEGGMLHIGGRSTDGKRNHLDSSTIVGSWGEMSVASRALVVTVYVRDGEAEAVGRTRGVRTLRGLYEVLGEVGEGFDCLELCAA